MSDVGIAVFGWKRARFLYVTLDSVSRCQYKSPVPIKVFIDGGLTAEELAAVKEVASFFPKFDFVFREKNLGTLNGITSGIEEMFSAGLDEVIWLEDDFLVTEDMIWYSQTLPRDAFFINLSWNKIGYGDFFWPRGNLIQVENFKRLKKWIAEERYYGVSLHDGRIPIPVDRSKRAMCDAVYRLFLIDQREQTFFPEDYKVACFGCVSGNEQCGPKMQALLDAMFEGPKDKWIDNILRLLKQPAPEGVHEIHWWPQDFRYYPMERLGGWSIGSTLYNFICDLLPKGSRILELGSGYGTGLLSQDYKLFSIENNPNWIGQYNSVYIHARLVDGWYDIEAIAGEAPKEYDLLLIDGPVGEGNRGKIFDNLDLFNLDGWIIFDDLHREADMKSYRLICDKLGRQHGEYMEDNKAFGVICQAGMSYEVFASIIHRNNLLPMQGSPPLP